MQRGELAIANFESRKSICMQYGVDEVYELDFAYATQAAHVFACLLYTSDAADDCWSV